MNIYQQVYLNLLTQQTQIFTDPANINDVQYQQIFNIIDDLIRSNIISIKIIKNTNKYTNDIQNIITIITLNNNVDRKDIFDFIINKLQEYSNFDLKIYELSGAPRDENGKVVLGFSQLKSTGSKKLIINNKYGFVLKGRKRQNEFNSKFKYL